MIERQRIVALARSCIGTPFAHQGRHPGAALDCVGLIVHVYRALGLAPAFAEEQYGRIPHPRRMREALGRYLGAIPLGTAGNGDVVWLAWRDRPQHLAILAEDGRAMIHAAAQFGGCVEHCRDAFWRARERGAFRFPGAA